MLPAPPGAPDTSTDDLRLRLERATYGATPALLAEVSAMGFGKWIDRQLDPATRTKDKSFTRLNAAIDATMPDLAELRTRDKVAKAGYRRSSIEGITARTVLGAAYAPDQLRQRMVDLLADRLHVAVSQTPVVYYVPAYDAMLRDHAFGRFSDLLVEMARHPAMLLFLDNATSRADGDHVPNENFGRELMELHTVGLDGGYDEVDVGEVAHVFSGWSLDRATGGYAFKPKRHSLGGFATRGDVLGWRPRGDGEAAGRELLEHLARHPATEARLALLMARRFVSEDIRADDRLVIEAARVYREHDTELGPVLRHLLTSDRFPAAATSMLRRPVDLVATTLRRGADAPTPDRLDHVSTNLSGLLRVLGQVPYCWPAPNGYPTPTAAWASAGAIIARWNAMTTLAHAAPAGLALDPSRFDAHDEQDLLLALCGPDIQLV
ncbi:MAG: DUF1800 domain-containing protein [Microthrixaceae bacterium]